MNDLEALLNNDGIEFQYEGKAYKVYPLTLEDIIFLWSDSKELLAGILDGKDNVEVMNIIKGSPTFLAKILRSGFRRTDVDVNKFKNLPVGLQLIALDKIVEASQLDIPFMGKLLSRFVKSATQAVETLKVPTSS